LMMNCLTLCLLMVGMMEGRKLMIKTNKKHYLAHMKHNKNVKTGSDYWLNRCSLPTPGEMLQEDVVGCGGGIELKCTGGCLRIHKILYACKMVDEPNQEQMKKVKALCDDKESCTVQASRTFFGNTECPDAPDSEMKLWITYSCDNEGRNSTKLTGPKECEVLDQCQIESLSFALDTSGSMVGHKDIWEPVMIKLVKEMAARQVNVDKHYLFSYVDKIEPAITTESPEEFIDKIKNNGLSNGGNEYTFAALKHAMEQVNKRAFVCVWTDEIGDDTTNAALKIQILDLKAKTNSEIFFMAIPYGSFSIQAAKDKFDDIGTVMDIKNDPDVITKLIETMKNSAICN